MTWYPKIDLLQENEPKPGFKICALNPNQPMIRFSLRSTLKMTSMTSDDRHMLKFLQVYFLNLFTTIDEDDTLVNNELVRDK